MKSALAALFCLLNVLSFSQDSLKYWSVDDFLNRVRQYHPQIKAAEYRLEQGEAAYLASRGNLDPKIKSQLAQKYYDGSQYYDLGAVGLQVPTWIGVDFDLNYFTNDGIYLNPENRLPNEGLVAGGITVPVGRGLFMDERRLAIKGAKISFDQAEQERVLMVNEVLFNAAITYWDWVNSYNNLQVYYESYELAQQRFMAVKNQVIYGDKPAVDTLEAYIQVQNRTLDLAQGQLDYKNSTASVSVFLWGDGFIPLEFSEEVVPTGSVEKIPFFDPYQYNEMDSFLFSHPVVRQAQLKIDQLKVEQKWKKELFKPQLDLKYQALQMPVGNWANSYNVNNYTWGLKFEMPLFYRKERGSYRLINAKLGEQRMFFLQKQKELEVKITQSINAFNTLDQQLKIVESLVQNRAKLLAAEREIFSGGESSLFLINAREMNYVYAKINLNDLVAKIWQEYSKVQYLTANWQ